MKTALAVVAPEADQIPSPVAPYVETNPVSVLTDEALRTRFFAEIKGVVNDFVPNLKTEKGRKEVASLAYKIARTKTAIDEAGKVLNEDARKKINAVDAVRKVCRDTLDGLRDDARKPLDDWEAAEAEREAKIKAILEFLDASRVIHMDATSEHLLEIIARVERVEDTEDFADAKRRALETLNAGRERVLKEEADRAELARLRAEQAERDRLEVEKQAAEQRAREEAERQAQAEKAAQERAETAAKRAVEEAASAERRKADEAIAAERRTAEEAAAKAKREADAEIARIAAEKAALERAEAARVAEEKRKADEQAARERDTKHRSEIMKAAKVKLMDACGLDEGTARKVVLAVVAGEIPNVSIRF